MKPRHLLITAASLAISTAALCASPANGDLVRTESSDLYYIREGKRCLVPSSDVLVASGLKEENAILISDEELTAIPEGQRFREPIDSYEANEGDLVSTPIGAVYLIQDGKRCLIPTSEVFTNRGFLWDEVIVIFAADLKAIPEGTLKPAEGDLVRSDEGRVYLIEDGHRFVIPNANEFIARGYKWDNVITVSEEDLEAIPEG